MKKKEITIEDLAIKVENGFQKSDKRFEDLAKIVKQNSVDIKESSIRIEKGFAVSDQKFEDLARMTQNGFLEMSKNMADGFANFKVYVDKRFDAMDKRFDSIDQQLISIRVEIKQIWEKIAEIEKKLDDVHIRTLEDDNAISTEIIKLENEIKFIKDDIKRIKLRQNIKA